MGEVIDVRERLSRIRRQLDEQDAGMRPTFARANYVMLLAFAKYAEIDGDELASLVKIAMAAEDINQGVIDVLKELGYEW